MQKGNPRVFVKGKEINISFAESLLLANPKNNYKLGTGIGIKNS